ncbi:aminotransferase class IV family protein [Sphaerisporangium sp. TRM90804]|uniref:aminotransferase class IV family protein n=1 Tax=Sphaerisporangium sp. TRM90804 TaxID=3031113 RepID=UPI00244A71DF|nr:aminotransferase class IV family protein [Sphaerisporangium sp. TRM90804]MDH2424957.1 aminotransferase class IV family protein [Sphaerisporangium sp. TRM90804]
MMELNGRPVTAEELRALAFANYGHFTSMRVEGMGVRGLALHLERLQGDCRILHGVDLDLDRVRHLARRAAAAAPSPVMIRVTVFDPELDVARPAADAHPEILVSTRPAPPDGPPPLTLGTADYERDIPEIKHTGLFGTVMQRRFAQLTGSDDVLFTDSVGRILEGATWNIGFVRDGRVVWPGSGCLNGVTMRLLNGVMERAGIPHTTAEVDLDDIHRVSSAFVTNAAAGPRPVRSIDGVELDADAPILTTLRREYAAIPGDPL